jgi:hypothetical protein
MDAPYHFPRARSLAVSALALAVAAVPLVVGGAMPGAAADDLGAVNVNSPATFSVIPKRCYTPKGEVRSGPCHIQRYGDHRPTVIVWGDSHAAQQIPALKVQARQTRTNLISFSMGLCPPMIVAKSDPDPCSRNAYKAMRFIEDKAARTTKPLTVVLGAFWYFYRTTKSGDRAERAATFRRGDDRAFTRLGRLSRQHGLRVAVIGQAPWIRAGGACTLRSRTCPRSVMIPAEASQTRYLKRHMCSIKHARLINIADLICTDRSCRVTACDVPVFYDVVHLNATLTARFASSFDWAFRDSGSKLVAAPCGVPSGHP